MNKLDLLAHPLCFHLPDRLTQILSWQEHIPFAMFLVEILRPRVIVELGTHAGDSYCAFCQAVSELRLETRCYAVDSWEGDPHSGFYGAEVLEDLRQYHDPRYGSFSRLIQSTFDEAVQYFADGSIDLLHIDGYHSYEAVKHDLETWLPKLSSNAVLLLHDTNVHEREFGIGRYWEEIKHRYSHFEFLHGHGLGILAIGKVRSREFQALLEATDQELTVIRDFFFHLGNRLTLAHDSAGKESMVRERDSRLAARETELNELRSTLDSRVAELEQRIVADQEKSRYEQERTQQRVLEKDQALRLLVENLAQKDQSFLEKDRAIQRLESRAAESEERVAVLSTQLVDIETQLKMSQERVGLLSVQLMDTETQLKMSQERVGLLSAQLVDTETQLKRSQERVGLLSAQLVDTETQLKMSQERVGLLSAQLADTETQLKRIRATLGWRLLSHYGPIKYRFLLPVYRLLGQVSAERAETKRLHGNPE